nr:hypothetical protein B0A51_11796 [Rachicladosporium sp. CCFEE 5018]
MIDQATRMRILRHKFRIDRKRAAIIRRGFGPLNYPPFNPYLQIYNKDYSKDAFPDGFTDEHFAKAHEIARAIERRNIMRRSHADMVVTRFGRSHLRFRNRPGRHLDLEIKRVHAGYLMHQNHLEEQAGKQVLLGFPAITTANLESMNEWLGKIEREAQHKTCKTVLLATKKLIEMSGGMEAWLAASDEEIGNLLTCLFDEFPLTISKLVFWTEDSAIDMERIWRNQFDQGKWQVLLRTKFVYLAMSTWENRIKHDDRDAMYEDWKDMMQNEELASLNLGDVADLPSRVSRLAGKGRKHNLPAKFMKWFRAEQKAAKSGIPTRTKKTQLVIRPNMEV